VYYRGLRRLSVFQSSDNQFPACTGVRFSHSLCIWLCFFRGTGISWSATAAAGKPGRTEAGAAAYEALRSAIAASPSLRRGGPTPSVWLAIPKDALIPRPNC